MKNKQLMSALSNAVRGDTAKGYGVELLDAQLDDVAGGTAPTCTGMKCGTFSSPASQLAD